ncbi:YciI family protein [Tessaracoccus oleiagri]|uniref:YCII-related domain-containing protein n=1 Tax=Tessaracoccus oleiagri TaxID=686624 RepID=A0A1G9KU98_9ACTN|nr:YciI family protein [Tessaracoccus oleiagri]SDL53291.1 hypothetical protein SAMN04488242_1834 [Tessaracoccus oleiagri]
MAYFAVHYTYGTDTESLDSIRPEHRAYLGSLPELVASGPLVGTDPGRALLLFRADELSTVEALLDEDPFAKAGLVASREVLPWNPVIGVFAQ